MISKKILKYFFLICLVFSTLFLGVGSILEASSKNNVDNKNKKLITSVENPNIAFSAEDYGYSLYSVKGDGTIRADVEKNTVHIGNDWLFEIWNRRIENSNDISEFRLNIGVADENGKKIGSNNPSNDFYEYNFDSSFRENGINFALNDIYSDPNDSNYAQFWNQNYQLEYDTNYKLFLELFHIKAFLKVDGGLVDKYEYDLDFNEDDRLRFFIPFTTPKVSTSLLIKKTEPVITQPNTLYKPKINVSSFEYRIVNDQIILGGGWTNRIYNFKNAKVAIKKGSDVIIEKALLMGYGIGASVQKDGEFKLVIDPGDFLINQSLEFNTKYDLTFEFESFSAWFNGHYSEESYVYNAAGEIVTSFTTPSKNGKLSISSKPKINDPISLEKIEIPEFDFEIANDLISSGDTINSLKNAKIVIKDGSKVFASKSLGFGLGISYGVTVDDANNKFILKVLKSTIIPNNLFDFDTKYDVNLELEGFSGKIGGILVSDNIIDNKIVKIGEFQTLSSDSKFVGPTEEIKPTLKTLSSIEIPRFNFTITNPLITSSDFITSFNNLTIQIKKTTSAGVVIVNTKTINIGSGISFKWADDASNEFLLSFDKLSWDLLTPLSENETYSLVANFGTLQGKIGGENVSNGVINNNTLDISDFTVPSLEVDLSVPNLPLIEAATANTVKVSEFDFELTNPLISIGDNITNLTNAKIVVIKDGVDLKTEIVDIGSGITLKQVDDVNNKFVLTFSEKIISVTLTSDTVYTVELRLESWIGELNSVAINNEKINNEKILLSEFSTSNEVGLFSLLSTPNIPQPTTLTSITIPEFTFKIRNDLIISTSTITDVESKVLIKDESGNIVNQEIRNLYGNGLIVTTNSPMKQFHFTFEKFDWDFKNELDFGKKYEVFFSIKLYTGNLGGVPVVDRLILNGFPSLGTFTTHLSDGDLTVPSKPTIQNVDSLSYITIPEFDFEISNPFVSTGDTVTSLNDSKLQIKQGDSLKSEKLVSIGSGITLKQVDDVNNKFIFTISETRIDYSTGFDFDQTYRVDFVASQFSGMLGGVVVSNKVLHGSIVEIADFTIPSNDSYLSIPTKPIIENTDTLTSITIPEFDFEISNSLVSTNDEITSLDNTKIQVKGKNNNLIKEKSLDIGSGIVLKQVDDTNNKFVLTVYQLTIVDNLIGFDFNDFYKVELVVGSFNGKLSGKENISNVSINNNVIELDSFNTPEIENNEMALTNSPTFVWEDPYNIKVSPFSLFVTNVNAKEVNKQYRIKDIQGRMSIFDSSDANKKSVQEIYLENSILSDNQQESGFGKINIDIDEIYFKSDGLESGKDYKSSIFIQSYTYNDGIKDITISNSTNKVETNVFTTNNLIDLENKIIDNESVLFLATIKIDKQQKNWNLYNKESVSKKENWSTTFINSNNEKVIVNENEFEILVDDVGILDMSENNETSFVIPILFKNLDKYSDYIFSVSFDVDGINQGTEALISVIKEVKTQFTTPTYSESKLKYSIKKDSQNEKKMLINIDIEADFPIIEFSKFDLIINGETIDSSKLILKSTSTSKNVNNQIQIVLEYEHWEELNPQTTSGILQIKIPSKVGSNVFENITNIEATDENDFKLIEVGENIISENLISDIALILIIVFSSIAGIILLSGFGYLLLRKGKNKDIEKVMNKKEAIEK